MPVQVRTISQSIADAAVLISVSKFSPGKGEPDLSHAMRRVGLLYSVTHRAYA